MLRTQVGIDRVIPGYTESQQEVYKKYINEKPVKLFRSIYNKNVEAAQNDISKKLRIPRIIHQIWLGSPLPEGYKRWMKELMSLKGWKYCLWTDEKVAKLKLYNQEIYDSSKNFGEKSDILRLELLNQFGGVYLDADIECIRPEALEELHTSFDFYIGFENNRTLNKKPQNFFTDSYDKIPLISNAVIGSIPKHPLIKIAIINLKDNCSKNKSIPVKTGPLYITQLAYLYEISSFQKERNIYFPCTFFYPVHVKESNVFLEKRELAFIPPETIFIHYWHGSWKKNPKLKGNIWSKFYTITK